MSLEPRRLFGRYVIGNPLFLLRSAILAAWPSRTPRERALPERRASAEAFGIGGPAILPRHAAGPMRSPAGPRSQAGEALQPVGMPDDRIVPAQILPTPIVPAAAVQPVVRAITAPVAAAATTVAPRDSAVSVFSANRPVVARDDLYGRQRDLDRLLAWVLDQSGNALIYGPRGYGKTSLVRVFGEIADQRGHVVLYASGSRDIGFDGLMRAYLGELPGFAAAALGAEPLTVNRVANLLAALPATSAVLIIDEFDRIERDDTRQNIVELIKDVSDLTAAVRFVLVGVATDAIGILGYHPSVQRCITCVPLPRLEPTAVEILFRKKAAMDRLSVGDAEVRTVVALTAGSAYHAQLIGQKLVADARRSGRNTVGAADLDSVIDDILSDAVLIDDGFARLARTMRQAPARRQLLRLAGLALAGPDDIVDLSGTVDDAELARVCAGLVGDGVLVPAHSRDNGPGFRFGNAFLPQLLMMIEHRAGNLQAVAG